MNNFKTEFNKNIKENIKKELGITNDMRVPRLTKIVVNMGVKGALADKKNMEVAASVLTEILGQKPKVTVSKQSIAGFKLREGDKIGLVVTLRGNRMYDFYEKLVKIVFPRVKDFHGVSKKSFDKNGNYTLGIPDYSVFAEVDLGKVEKVFGLEITIVTTAKNPKEAFVLLEKTGMPFVKS